MKRFKLLCSLVVAVVMSPFILAICFGIAVMFSIIGYESDAQ